MSARDRNAIGLALTAVLVGGMARLAWTLATARAS